MALEPKYPHISSVVSKDYVWGRVEGDALCAKMNARHKRELVESREAGFG